MPTIVFFVAEWNENFGEIRLKGLKKQKQCNVFVQKVTISQNSWNIQIANWRFLFFQLGIDWAQSKSQKKKILFKNIGIIWWSVKSSVGDFSSPISQFLNEWTSRKLVLLLVAETNREKGEPGCWGKWNMATHKGGERDRFAFHNQMKITQKSGHRWIVLLASLELAVQLESLVPILPQKYLTD